MVLMTFQRACHWRHRCRRVRRKKRA